MAPVFGHGRLRLYLLKLLDESPKHGYEIIQQLKERFSGLYAPSAGTVYPRLSRLESEGLIRHESDERGRKVYHITAAGRAELEARAEDMAALESEIRASVRDLAAEIRDEVKESARHIQEELQKAAQEAQSTSSGAKAASSAAGASHCGPSRHPVPAGDRSDRSERDDDRGSWGKDDWREWKRAQHDWKEQWKDQWAAQWKDQWAAQWRDHWQDEAAKWKRMAEESVDDWTGRRSRDREDRDRDDRDDRERDDRGGDRGDRERDDRGDREQFDELRSSFLRFRDEVRSMARERRPDSPVSPDQMAAAREVLERAARELREIFRG
jgi:DNA-binding PadR family transcriptional regulator